MKRMPLFHLPPTFIFSVCGAGLFFCGLTLGTLIGLSMIPSPPIILSDDTRPKISVVHLEGLRDGAIRGSVSGTVRVFVGDAIVLPDGSGSFQIRDRSFLTNTITIHAPVGMRFVASKRGHTYYLIGSKGAESIVPANRRYFSDSESAKTAGYKSSGK